MGAPVWGAIWTAIVNTAVSYAISSITNKLFGPKAQNNSPTYAFGRLQTQTNSGMVMPLAYGRVKCAGNMIWASDPGTVQHKLVSFGVGKIKGFSGVCLNDLLLKQGPIFKIHNTLYADATVSIKIANKLFVTIVALKKIVLKSNGTTKEINIGSKMFSELFEQGNIPFDSTIMKLKSVIENYGNGWVITETITTSNKLSDINLLAETPCYNSPVNIVIDGIPGCSYTEYLGDGEQLIDNRIGKTTVTVDDYGSDGEGGETLIGSHQEDVFLSEAEKAKIVGGLKYDAYLAITATAGDKLTGDYNVTAIVDGRIVRVYSSPTTYTEQWSDNPAWCELDFKTSVDGCGMEYSSVDLQSYVTAARYYDELVNGRKRFTLNLILDEKKSRQDWVNEIFSVCRSYQTYQRGLHGVLVDKPEPVSQVFKVKPDESIETWWQDNAEDVERLQIEYVDPEYEYTKVVAQANRVQIPGETSQFRNKVPLTKKISIYGINNFEQASREAWFHLNKAQTCPEWIQYTTNKRALNRSIGDVVGVWNPITEVVETGLPYKRYRIMSMSEPQENRITMAMQEYNPNLYGDTMGSVVPIINITKLNNPATPPPDVTGIRLAQVYYCQNDGTIISYITGACILPDYSNFSEARFEYSINNGLTWTDAGKTNSDGTFIIDNVKTSINYIVRIRVGNRMGIVSDGIVSDAIYITGKDHPPSNIPSVTAAIDQTDSTKIQLSWPAVADIDLRGYRVMEGSTVLTPTPIVDTRYTYTATSSRQHNFSVVAIDNSGNPSQVAAKITINITIEPAQVAGFYVVIQETDRSRLNLSWIANSESDISFYEIRVGDDWEHSTLLATQLKANNYTHVLTTEGSQNFMVKAIKIAGHASQQPASRRLQIILRPDVVTNLQTAQEPRDRSMVKVTWSASPGKDIAGYELRYGSDWASGIPINSVKENTYWWYIPSSGTYNVMVQARTVAGYVSNISNISITAMVEAYDVVGFGAVQLVADRTKVRLSWDQPLSLDVAYFEIRKGATWDSGSVIGQRVTGTYFDVIVKDETPQAFWIKAVSVAGKYSQNPSKTAGIFNMNPSPVSNIQIQQNPNDKSIVNIMWLGISEADLVGYQVKIGQVWESAEALPLTQELYIQYRPNQTGDIKVMIKTVNAAGFYSDEMSEHYYATLEPATVTGLQVLQNGEYNELYWDKHTEPDVTAYEIREGASFDLGTLIASGVTLNSYTVKVDVERNYRYHVKAINRANRYSKQAISQGVAVANLPPKNVILTYDDITLQNGSSVNTEFGQSLINWSNIGGRWSDYTTTKFSDVGGTSVLKLFKHKGMLSQEFKSGLDWGYGGFVNNSVRGGNSEILFNGSKVMKIIGYNFISTDYIPVDATKPIYGVLDIYQKDSAPGTVLYMGVRCYDSNGVETEGNAGCSNYFVVSNTVPNRSTWNHYNGTRTLPVGTAKIKLILLVHYPAPTDDTTSVSYIGGLNVWQGEVNIYSSTGTYTCKTIDVGQVITANISTKFISSVILRGTGSAILQIRTSRDGITWTAWQDFRPAQYTFRYLDRRVLLATTDPTKTPEVNQLTTSIDVDDMDDAGSIIIPVSGCSVLFKKLFYTVPVLTPTALGENRFAVVTNKTKSGFSVKITDRAGIDVGGNLDWRVKGY